MSAPAHTLPGLIPKLAERRLSAAATLTLAFLLTAGIFALRLVVHKEASGLLALLVVPIGLLAARFGWRAGVSAGAGALALVALWDGTQGVHVGPLGYLTRAVAYLWIGLLTGALAASHGLASERPRYRLLTRRPQVSPPQGRSELLSPREWEVLELVALGATNAQVAARFVISEDTVKSHVKHILQKLGASNRTEAALWYVETYGHPPESAQLQPIGESGLVPETPRPEPAHLQATSERSATIVGLSRSVVLKLDDGRSIETPLVEEIIDQFDLGSPALVYFDHAGNPVGWFLPEAEVGVDMRGTAH
jgi:DNA-binding CsgD family transcriptional regulator